MQALRENEAGLRRDERLERLRLFGLGSPAMLLILVILVIPVGWLFYVSFIGADGKLDIARLEPIARMGYYDYTVVREVFEMRIPGAGAEALAGLEGKG
jgi:putative spermidine/putrescine transport system permease protein/spermidine/putrescine transport system permease protein